MKKIKRLDIIENDYQIVDWYILPHENKSKVFSNIRKFEGMNELEDYKISGVYKMAEVPHFIKKINPYQYEEEPYLAFAKAYSDSVYKSIKEGNVFLATGSYCTHIPSILGGIRRAVGTDSKIGVIWIDAHADNHIVEDTSEDRLRLLGVPMAVFLGQTLPEWRIKAGLEPPIQGSDIIASDIRYLDDETKRNLVNSNVNVINQKEFNNLAIWEEEVNKLSQKVDYLYVHIDADILNHEYLPAYEYNVINGNKLEPVISNIAAIMKTGKVIGVSVMCIGFENQPDRLRDVNNMNGIRLVSAVLRHWKNQPE